MIFVSKCIGAHWSVIIYDQFMIYDEGRKQKKHLNNDIISTRQIEVVT